MMKNLAFFLTGLVLLIIQLTLAVDLAVYSIKPNVLLFSVAIFGLRLENPWLFIYGVLTGLGADIFSHGLLGANALSFMGVYFLARVMRSFLYANTLFLTTTLIFGLIFTGNLIYSTLFFLLDSSVPWAVWVFLRGSSEAFYTSLLTPLPLLFWHQLEKWYASGEAA